MASKKRLAMRLSRKYARQAKAWHSDVLGSYTGAPLYGEVPVQDADDL